MITSHDNCLEETDHHFEVGRLKKATTRPLVGAHCKLQGAHQPRGYQFGLGDHGLLLYYQFFLFKDNYSFSHCLLFRPVTLLKRQVSLKENNVS